MGFSEGEGFDPPNATFLIRPGYLEITTISNAYLDRLLGQAVHASFDRTPLIVALEELCQATGVPVVVDTRAWRQAQRPISASFTNRPSLGGVLLVLSEMGGLKMLVGDNMIYLTTPAHARQLLRERFWMPFHMQSEGGSMVRCVCQACNANHFCRQRQVRLCASRAVCVCLCTDVCNATDACGMSGEPVSDQGCRPPSLAPLCKLATIASPSNSV